MNKLQSMDFYKTATLSTSVTKGHTVSGVRSFGIVIIEAQMVAAGVANNVYTVEYVES